MRRLWPKQLSDTGDTIVEVLIAVAVVSSVLAGAFTVSQKSTLAVRNSQEHSEMLQLLQSQVELVRSLALEESSETAPIFASSPKYFCIDDSASPAVRANFNASVVTLPALASDNFANYNAKCKAIGPQNFYNVAITYDASSKIFTFTGRWDGLGGNKQQEQLVYRIYPGQLAFVAPPMTPPTTPPTWPPVTSDPNLDAAIDTKSNANQGSDSGSGTSGTPPVEKKDCWETKGWTDLSCWDRNFVNQSVNDPGTLASCSWDWGDGSKVETYAGTSAQCQNGAKIRHQYTPVGTEPTHVTYTVVLTNIRNNGDAKTSNRVQVWLPN